MNIWLGLTLVFLSVFCFAEAPQNELTFGPEFTFSSERISNDPNSSLVIFAGSLTDHDRPNRYRRVNDNDQLPDEMRNFLIATGLQDQIGIRFARDMGVVEVTTTPMTADQIEKYKNILQRDIFDLIKKKQNGKPSLYLGGGHINVGTSYFIGRHPLLFYNFIIDFFNNNQLALGIWNYDTNNALPFSLLAPSDKLQVLAILKNWYKRLIARTDRLTQNEILKIGNELHDFLYNTHDMFCAAWNRCSAPLLRGKHHALNFLNIGATATSRFEIRSIRPQKDIQTYLNQVKLIRARVRYLEKRKRPLSYKPRVPILKELNPAREHKLTPPVVPELALRAFYEYVTESGEKWADHRDYVWPIWITGGELAKFEESQWFLDRANNNPCEGALQ